MLCTVAQIEKYLSYRGAVAFSDHADAGLEDADVIDDARSRASDELLAMLYPLYAEADLATSALVSHWAVVMAAYYLCHTRGNSPPAAVAMEYEQLTRLPDGLIERVRLQKMVLPGLARRSVNVPAWSNLTIDRRYRREKIRVIAANSSPIQTAIEQDKAPELTVDH